ILFLLLACTTLFYVSCGSDEEDPTTVYPGEEFPNERLVKLPPQAAFYEYKLNDVTGFDRHPLIETVKPWETTSIITSDGFTFEIKDFGMVFPSYTVTGEEEYEKIYYEIKDHGSTVGEANSSFEDLDFLVGLKNNRIWTGAFDPSTREQKKEWLADAEIPRTYNHHLGYGEYEEYYLNYLTGRIYQPKDQLLATLNLVDTRNETPKSLLQGFYLLTDKPVRLDIEEKRENIKDIYSWYEDSFIIDTRSDYYLVKPNGTTHQATNYFYPEYSYPISYEQLLLSGQCMEPGSSGYHPV
ncbi:MAG: hypothetical protein LUE93_06225, partial [Bacteroides sp.]|nr:hypothetical protein [Bacteroides sp.]